MLLSSIASASGEVCTRNGQIVPIDECNAVLEGSAAVAAGAAVLFGVLLIVGLIFLLCAVCFVVWVVTLIHVFQHEDVPDRTVWIILHFIALGIFAGPVYYFAVMRPYNKKHAPKSVQKKSK